METRLWDLSTAVKWRTITNHRTNYRCRLNHGTLLLLVIAAVAVMVAVEEEMVEEVEAEGKLIYHPESSASFFRTTSGLTPLSA
jgi:hypothetical protein